MVVCGACKAVVVDADGKERDDSQHCCVECKKPLHAIVNAADCFPWMPEDGYYFCGKACLQKHNTSVVDEARLECRESGDPEPFGPDHGEDWPDWLVDNPNKWFPLCPRPGDEVQLAEDFEEETFEKEIEPAPKDTAGDTQTPPQTTGALAALMQEGARIQESFRMGDTDETGAWFGGLVGPMINGRVAIGLDDGELVTRTKAEINGLYSMGKFCACTRNSGLVQDKMQNLRAGAFCMMTCAKELLPVGVLLVNPDDLEPTALVSQVYHSHVMSVDALEAAMSSLTAAPRPRRGDANLQRRGAGRTYVQTLWRGNWLKYMGECDGGYMEEIVYGEQVFFDKTQQHRYVITYDPALEKFSVGCWTAWQRVPLQAAADTESVNLEDCSMVKVASEEQVTMMELTWPYSHLAACNTKDKLKKQALLGPAQLQERRAAAVREKQKAMRASQRAKGKADVVAKEAAAKKVPKDKELAAEKLAKKDRERTAAEDRTNAAKLDKQRTDDKRRTEDKEREERELAALLDLTGPEKATTTDSFSPDVMAAAISEAVANALRMHGVGQQQSRGPPQSPPARAAAGALFEETPPSIVALKQKIRGLDAAASVTGLSAEQVRADATQKAELSYELSRREQKRRRLSGM